MSMLPKDPWLKEAPELGVYILVHAQPGAKRTQIVGQHGERLKVALAVPPVDGKANAMLIKSFAKWLDVPKQSIEIVSGDFSREKRLLIKKVDASTLHERIVAHFL